MSELDLRVNLAPSPRGRWRWEHLALLALLLALAGGAGVRPEAVLEFGRAATCAMLADYAAATDAPAAAASYERLRAYRPADARYQGALALPLLGLYTAGGDERAQRLISELSGRGLLLRGDPRLLFALGDYHAAVGRVPEAAAMLEAALHRVAPGGELDFEVRYRLGGLLDDVGRDDEAELLFLGLVDGWPHRTDALNALGYHYAERGERLDEAERLIDRAIRLHQWRLWEQLPPWRGDHLYTLALYLDSLGWAAYQADEDDRAEALLGRAVELTAERPDAVLLYHLAQVHYDSGRDRQALRLVEQALGVDPSYGPARRLYERLDSTLGERQIIRGFPYDGLPAIARIVDPRDRQRRAS